MILSDGGIQRRLDTGDLFIEPIEPQQIQPASVDFRLSDQFLITEGHQFDVIDPYHRPDGLTRRVVVPEGQAFVLHPHGFVLGSSIERLALPDDLVARVDGKSSLGRLGLLIHATAGFVDPGWPKGQITLEMSNVAMLPIRLWPGMTIGQFSFHTLDAPALRPYGHPDLKSKYVGQDGPIASRYHMR